MGRVRLLSDSVINKIAAGEVIERPASVVKELVENSLDAGAGRVAVFVEGGGRSLIRIVDDGLGMSREDAQTALQRHATSKIRDDGDLFRITTLGFRGEALPSIAEVSRFELITGQQQDEVGTRLVLDGGVWERCEDAPNPGGTEIAVRRLFFNTPVRLKFLKSPRTELSHLADVVQRMALANPDVAFQLHVDGRRVLDLAPADALIGRVRDALGKGVAAQLRPVQAATGELKLEGLLSTPSLHRSGNGGLYLYVNGRFVRDRTLVGSVLSAYRNVLPSGRYPVVVLFLDLPPELVDVNVHPAKVEVRFQEGAEVFRFLGARLSDALAGLEAGTLGEPALFADQVGRPTVRPALGPLFDAPAEPPTRTAVELPLTAPPSAAPPADAPRLPETLDPLGRASTDPVGASLALAGDPARIAEQLSARSGRAWPSGRPAFREARVVGLFGPWLLADDRGALLAVDVAAAHQRILFESLGRLGRDGVPARRLLVPELLELDEEAARLAEVAPLLAGFGLELSSFGGGTLALHGVPRGVSAVRARRAVLYLAERYGGRLPKPRVLRVDVVATLAAQLAVEPGTQLSEGEQRILLRCLEPLDLAFASPWGAPITARVPPEDVARWFGRRS